MKLVKPYQEYQFFILYIARSTRILRDAIPGADPGGLKWVASHPLQIQAN